MNHVRHAPGTLEEALTELARLVVAIPVETLGQAQALRGIETQAMHFGKGE